MLIAEDGDLSYEIEAELLEDRGAKCTRAENGQRCVELFRNAPAGTFDAILMDMQMPVMDGLTGNGGDPQVKSSTGTPDSDHRDDGKCISG